MEVFENLVGQVVLKNSIRFKTPEKSDLLNIFPDFEHMPFKKLIEQKISENKDIAGANEMISSLIFKQQASIPFISTNEAYNCFTVIDRDKCDDPEKLLEALDEEIIILAKIKKVHRGTGKVSIYDIGKEIANLGVPQGGKY